MFLHTQDKGVTFDKDEDGQWLSGCSKCVHCCEQGMGVDWHEGISRILNRAKNPEAGTSGSSLRA